MERKWGFLNNPFINCSNDSFPVMRKIGNYTVNALHKYPLDTFLAARYAILYPLNKAYGDKFVAWDVQKSSHLSGSSSFKSLKKELSSKNARKWDNKLQLTYDKDTDEYLNFFPHHRKPYQSGSNESIMGAVSVLSAALGNDSNPALIDLKTEVDAFDILFKAAFEKQQGEEAGTANNSDDLEEARITLGVELYSTLGLMMDHYKLTPDKISNFFDLETIRNHEQSIFRSNIKAGELLQVLTHTFYPEEELIFINRGNTPLRIIILDDKESIPVWSNKYIEMPAKSHRTIAASDIGNPPETRFLKVKNMSADTNGSFTLELL